MNRIVIVGAGGFGKEIALCIEDINKAGTEAWDLCGFYDDGLPQDENVFDTYHILGNVNDLAGHKERLAVIISINNPATREKVAGKLMSNANLYFPNIIHPSAVTYLKDGDMGIGNLIFLFCVISFDVKMGDFNMINSYSGIGHDARIGNFNSFNPRVAISGGVQIGNANEFGMNSGVVQYKKIGSNNVIGANALMLRSGKDNTLYFGVPAVKVKL